jgi:hypothetical protein
LFLDCIGSLINFILSRKSANEMFSSPLPTPQQKWK